MKETDTMLLFWKGWPGQWPITPFVDYNGVEYSCSEQYMMAEKARLFNDQTALKAILASKSPKEQKAIGRAVKGFNAHDWDLVSPDVVFRGNLFKFTQSIVSETQTNETFLGSFDFKSRAGFRITYKELLLATGTKILVEASPVDKIYGIGLAEDDPNALDSTKWQGENRLGEVLMKVRSTLQKMK